MNAEAAHKLRRVCKAPPAGAHGRQQAAPAARWEEAASGERRRAPLLCYLGAASGRRSDRRTSPAGPPAARSRPPAGRRAGRRARARWSCCLRPPWCRNATRRECGKMLHADCVPLPLWWLPLRHRQQRAHMPACCAGCPQHLLPCQESTRLALCIMKRPRGWWSGAKRFIVHSGCYSAVVSGV